MATTDREPENQRQSIKSQLSADIIVYKSRNPEAENKLSEAGGENIEGANFAAKAEKPSGRQKTSQEQQDHHEEIGTMVFE